MNEFCYFNGKRFYRNTGSKNWSDRNYFKRIEHGTSVYLHRLVWSNTHGDIPHGYHVHHIDGDTSNNSIENLECLPARYHRDKHEFSEETIEKLRAHLDSVRHLSKRWHSSDEGREWHSKHAKRTIAGNFEKNVKCLECGVEFTAKASHNKSAFCSNAHKSAYRRKMGYDNIDKPCAFCNKIFSTNKYAKIETCSRSCANRLRHARKLESMNDKT